MKALQRLGVVLLLGAFLGAMAERTIVSTAGADTHRAASLMSFMIPGAGPVCPGDLNGDKQVNGADLSILLATFGDNCIECTVAGDCELRPNTTVQCVNNECVYTCLPLTGDCNGDPLDGCERFLNSISSCGGCNQLCIIPNGTPTCVNGQCQIASCNAGFADCDGNPANGCEVDTNSSPVHCGSCSQPCVLPNAMTFCNQGECQIMSCLVGWGNCDGLHANGCETSLLTPTNCASCGTPCNLPNAVETCMNGVCVLQSCLTGFSNCDGNEANGCEVNHTQSPNTCATASFVGSFCADTDCDPFCTGSSEASFANRTGRTSQWFRATAEDCEFCSGDLRHVVRLSVPAGVNYDLFVYSACGTLIGMSTNGVGALDQVVIQRPDNSGTDETFNYIVEVRYQSGTSCSNWSLTFLGRGC